MHPPYELTYEALNELRSRGIGVELWLGSLAVYLTLAWQLSFPFLAFRPGAKWWIVGGAVLGMFGCWLIYRLPVFGPAHVVATLAFLPAADWNRVFALVGSRKLTAPESGIAAVTPSESDRPVPISSSR
jgi:hypothetical protein